MPTYFFDLTDDDGFHRDTVGLDLDGVEKARKEARMLLPSLARESFSEGEHHVIECSVRDAAGEVVFWGSLTYRGETAPGADGNSSRSPSL